MKDGRSERPRLPTSLHFQTNLLCFSLLYLFTTLFLLFYISLTAKRCAIVSPSLHLPLKSLFSYPFSYREHKHAIPTFHSSCKSSIKFSDYRTATEEIDQLCRNTSVWMSPMTYMQGPSNSFSGNFSTQMRRSYFDFNNVHDAIPCGFMMDFPLRESDRLAMEKCNKVVVVSAIFGDHDKIRQPRGLGRKTLELACFFMFIDDITLGAFSSHGILSSENQNSIGVWRIVNVLGKLPYEDLAMNGVIPKHLTHRLFPNSKFSIWLDAKLQLMVDPVLLIHSLVIKENVDMAVSKHPFNVHTLEEAIATARWKKWYDISSLRKQMESYCSNGLEPWTPKKLPYTTDVPDSALILRKHGLPAKLFSCLLFNELEAFNPRDQLAFAYIRDLMSPRIKVNMFDSEVFEHVTMEYRHNIKHTQKHIKPAYNKEWLKLRMASQETTPSICGAYLSEMWKEPK